MEIYVINPFQSAEPHFPIVGMLPSYHSCLWNPQLYGLGYFQIIVAATKENSNLLRKGRMLVRQCDIVQNNSVVTYQNAMIIRRVEITYDADQGYLMIVSGKSVKDILSQRIVWDRYEAIDTSLILVISTLLIRNVTNPTGYIQDKLDELADEFTTKTAERTAAAAEVTRIAGEVSAAQADTLAARNRLDDAIDDLEDKTSASESANTAYNNKKEQRDDKKDELDDAKSDAATAKAAYERAVEEYGEDSPQAQSAKDVWDAYKAEVVQLQSELDTLEIQLAQAERNKNTATDELALANAEANIAQTEYDDCVTAEETAQGLLDDANEALAAIITALSDIQSHIGYYNRDLVTAQKRVIPYIDANLVDYGFTPPEITCQLRGENLGGWIEDMCIQERLGWDLILRENSLSLWFTAGEDKTDTVIFSPEFDNLQNGSYVSSVEAFRNAILVLGEGEGEYQLCGDVGTSEGVARYEEYADASAEVTREEDSLVTDAEYMNMLKQYGSTEIAALMRKTAVTGEVDTEGVFKIGEDFKMGDFVTIEVATGISTTVRLTEIIYSDEASGTLTTGTFEEWED